MLVATSSAGTVAVSVLAPVPVGVWAAKVTVVDAPGASEATVCVLVKVVPPVTLSVTGRLVRASEPALVMNACAVCATYPARR